MYKELKKYKTGNKVDGVARVGRLNSDVHEIPWEYDEYVFGYGDLIEDFIKHQQKPFWRRKYYHKHLTKIYKDALNQIKVRHGL